MVKIGFCDFWSSFNPNSNFITNTIKTFADVSIVPFQSADYVFFSVFGDQHLEAPNESIKIFYTGENICPDFNLCDYAIGFEWLDFADRYLRYPLYLTYENINELMEKKHIFSHKFSIDTKKEFCSFTVSNERGHPIRKELFLELSKYKLVNSGGKWLNNIGEPIKDKLSFDLMHKFSIVCENSSHPGYTTEKIVQAFAARTIPIYWGDPYITKIFNQKSFINVHNYNNVNDLTKDIIKIDNNNDEYFNYLKEPALLSSQYSSTTYNQKLKDFLSNIIEQPIEKAQRRNRYFWGEIYINRMKNNVYRVSEHQSLKDHIKTTIYNLPITQTILKFKNKISI